MSPLRVLVRTASAADAEALAGLIDVHVQRVVETDPQRVYEYPL